MGETVTRRGGAGAGDGKGKILQAEKAKTLGGGWWGGVRGIGKGVSRRSICRKSIPGGGNSKSKGSEARGDRSSVWLEPSGGE